VTAAVRVQTKTRKIYGFELAYIDIIFEVNSKIIVLFY
jgi:hypothetical protein